MVPFFTKGNGKGKIVSERVVGVEGSMVFPLFYRLESEVNWVNGGG